MSKRVKKPVNNSWMDPGSQSAIPRSTSYKQRKTQLETLAHMAAIYESSESGSESEIEAQNTKIHIETQVEQTGLIEVDNPIDVATVEVNRIHECISAFNDEETVNDGSDWIQGMLTPKNIPIEDLSEEEGEEDEDEKEFREKSKIKKKQDKNKQFLNERLCHKTSTSNGEVILMCMLIGVRHSLTWAAMLDIFNAINKLFSKDVLNMSKFKLLSFFPERKDWFTYHIYCPDCKHYIGNRTELPNAISCSSCTYLIEDTKKAPYFLTLNIQSQLKELFENPLIQPHLTYKHDRVKSHKDNIEDIQDGDLYKTLSSTDNVLSNPLNYSYTFNTDGCQTSDSSPTSVWPVYLRINELPPKIRNDNLVLAGLWVNEEKPIMNTFLQPLVDEFNRLSSEGVQWKMNEQLINSKIIPLCCCVDSPCRCSLLNMKQYNGIYGCTFCYHPTDNVNGIRKYPISKNVPLPRTHDNIVEDMQATRVINEQTGKTEIVEVTGVKGASALLNLKYFNLADGMTPDSMHCVYLGVTEQYMNIILSTCNAPYYIGSPSHLTLIDQRLLSIKAPKVITRTPRSLRLRNSWKASEWRSWLLYYSLPCLSGILPLKYFENLSKLVCGISLLLQDSISVKEIRKANTLLVSFLIDFQHFFGEHQMTYNMHLLLHLARSVENLGPLYVHDAFCFENENRLLLQMKKSPTEIAVQIAKRHLFYKSIPLFSTYFKIGPRVIEFIENFENRIKSFVKIDRTVVLGAGQAYRFNEKEEQLNYTGFCLSYPKLIYNGVRYSTKTYTQNLKIDDSVIETCSGSKGIITNICVLNDCGEEKIVIFYNPVQIVNTDTFSIPTITHISECFVKSNELRVCTPKDLKRQGILITVNNKMYICNLLKGSLGD